MKKTKGKLYRSDNEFGTSFFYEYPKGEWWIWIPLTLHTESGVVSPFWMHIQNERIKIRRLKRASKLEFLLLTGHVFKENEAV